MLNYKLQALGFECISQAAFNAFRQDRLQGSPLSVVDYKILDRENNWEPIDDNEGPEPYEIT